jgi:hypothetical protein
VAAYGALVQESSLADALIRARIHADMTQEDVAQAMGNKQGRGGTTRRRSMQAIAPYP